MPERVVAGNYVAGKGRCRKRSLPETSCRKRFAGKGFAGKEFAGNGWTEKSIPILSLLVTIAKTSIQFPYTLFFIDFLFALQSRSKRFDVYVNVNKLLFAVQQNAKRKYYQCLFAIFLSVPYFCSLVIISDIFNP